MCIDYLYLAVLLNMCWGQGDAEEGGHDVRQLARSDDIPRARIMDASSKDRSMD